jgi:hypothetical protein
VQSPTAIYVARELAAQFWRRAAGEENERTTCSSRGTPDPNRYNRRPPRRANENGYRNRRQLGQYENTRPASQTGTAKTQRDHRSLNELDLHLRWEKSWVGAGIETRNDRQQFAANGSPRWTRILGAILASLAARPEQENENENRDNKRKALAAIETGH